MLLEISIKNFILIEKATIRFKQGLNIISGETGAGKSIFLTALKGTLGEKINHHQIMPEKDQLKISTIFDISDNKEVQTQLDEMGIDYEKDELILRREANREGKSRCYINDETVRLAQLKQIASHLIDIHGQHENQFLFQVKNHLFILDSYLNLNEILENYQFIFDEWKDKKEDYLETLRKEKEISQEKELLLFNINQLKDNLIPEETYYKLKQKLSTVENHGKISNNFSKIDEKIYHHIFPQMQEVISLLEDIDRTDASHQDLLTSSREILFALEDVKNKVGALTNDEYLEMNKVDEIHEQLAKVERVKKKYQMSIGDLYTKLKDSKEKINFLEDCSLEKKEKEKELQQTEKKLIEQAINLHMKRKAGLDELADKIKKELHILSMVDSQLKIHLYVRENENGISIKNKKVELNKYGIDEVEFLFSSSPKMPLKKLREIASGGEISRVMLSIKACLQDKQTSHIMVFDEIDTGIGGTTAIHVGRKMLELSKFRQLIVITHLPQIAKYADHHLQVNKTSTVESSDTLTTILELDVEERLKEIARMLSGKVSPTELEFAKKFIAEK